MLKLGLKSICHHSGTQPVHQSIYQFLFLGPSRSHAKLFTGLLQHGDGQLSQGPVLHVIPHLFFWHLRFGLLLASSVVISCTIENAYTDRTISGVI